MLQAGIGVIGVAKTMVSEIFGANEVLISMATTSTLVALFFLNYVVMLSAFNIEVYLGINIRLHW